MKCKIKRQHEPNSMGNRLAMINEIKKQEELGNTQRAETLRKQYKRRYN